MPRRRARVARLARDFPRAHEPCPISSDRALDNAIITAPEALTPYYWRSSTPWRAPCSGLDLLACHGEKQAEQVIAFECSCRRRGDAIMLSPELELDLRASIRTIPDCPLLPGMCSATSPRCSAMRARSAAPSTSWCSHGPATRSTRSPASRRAASSPAARCALVLGRIRADPQEEQAALQARHHRSIRSRYGAGRDGDARGRGGGGRRGAVLVDDLVATGGAAQGRRQAHCAGWAPRCWPPQLHPASPISVAPRSSARSTCRCAR